MNENVTLVFDMDGTIADLYAVSDWLENIIAENVRPYAIAEPIYNMNKLVNVINRLKENGWRVAIVSWTSKHGSKEYNKAVRKVKKEWLDRYNFPYDELHVIKYGTPKSYCMKKTGGFQILFDDEEPNRKAWRNGSTVNANEDIYKILKNMLTV